MKENFKDYQGLVQQLYKFQGFQDAYKSCNKLYYNSISIWIALVF